MAASVKSLDLRWEEAPRYEVNFASRRPSTHPVSAGHAFVTIVAYGPGGNVLHGASFGLYPHSAADLGKAVLKPVPSRIAEDDWKKKADTFLTAIVSARQYELVKATVSKWSGKEYGLIFTDCATFVLEVAGNLMLKQPAKGGLGADAYLPHKLMEKLREINSQGDVIGGQWNSTDPQRRWALSTRDVDCDFTERAQSGSTLAKTLKLRLGTFDLSGAVPTTWRIERDNDAEVLRFLGARESLIVPILGAGPGVSYGIARRLSITDAQLEWYGLAWRVDAKGKLAGIDQPGSKPPKTFSLKRQF